MTVPARPNAAGGGPVLFAAFGSPGALSAWGIPAVGALIKEAAGAVTCIATDRLEEALRQMPPQHHAPVLITSQFPDRALTAFISKSQAPAIIFADRAADSLVFLRQHSAEADLSLARTISASLACLAPLRMSGRTMLIMRRQLRALGLLTVLVQMSRHLGLEISAEAFAKRLRGLYQGVDRATSLALQSLISADQSSGDRGNAVPASEALRNMVRSLDSLFSDSDPAPLVWPPEVFCLGDRPGEALQEPLPLTGGARCLVYGPYLHLPPGAWTARAIIDFEHVAGDQDFVVEIHAAQTLARAEIRPPAAGVFAATLAFRVTLPEVPIEFRIFLANGAIEGRLMLHGVELKRAGRETVPAASRAASPADGGIRKSGTRP